MIDTSPDSKLTGYGGGDLKINKIAYFIIIVAATLWGTIGFFIKELMEFGFSPMHMVFIRAIGASITLILFLVIKDRKLLIVNPRDSLYFIGTGILSFVFFNWCYFIAINKTSLAIAAILLYTAPSIVMVLSVMLFKEKMTKKKIISLVLTFLGCVFVTISAQGNAQKVTFTGILAGLGSGLGYALYSIFGRYALKKYHPLTVTLYTFIFASIGLIPMTDVKEMIGLFSNVNTIYYAIALSLIATVLPFLLYTKGLSQLDTSKASIIATLEPIVATIIGIILYNEPITLYKIVGMSIVIFAVSIQ